MRLSLGRSSLCLLTLVYPRVHALIDTSGWVGAEYTPAAAPGNSLWWNWFEDYETSVERELAMAQQQLGITSVRMFLHSMVYAENASRLLRNMDRFLEIAALNHIRTGFVFFGDCFNRAGASLTEQCRPVKGRHNGCWMTSPQDVERTSVELFRPYVTDIVTHFKDDPRILWWEVFNEPNLADSFTVALRSAGYSWVKAVGPRHPVLSCWDDNNFTDIVDHHDYGSAFKTGTWSKAIFSDLRKGAFITEAGSRWYQPPDSFDAGSPLTVLNYLESLRLDPSVPFVPGALISWELMVGNSNTRWHWSTKEGAAEPAIPWDAWLFPDGTPVSYTEAAALRRYITGVDDFLSFAKFLPHVVADGDQYLRLSPGQEWHADVKGGVVADALVEVAFWPEQPGSVFSLALRTKNHTRSAAERDIARRSSLSVATKQCTSPQKVMADTDIAGTVNYTNLKIGGGGDPVASCQQACCNDPSCTAWVLKQMEAGAQTDKNCRAGDLCCWLKPITSTMLPKDGAKSSYIAREPEPTHERHFDGYFVIVNASTLVVEKVAHGTRLQLSSFDLNSLENGVVQNAWNMLRVRVVGARLDVWFNPMYPETGYDGTTEDCRRVPKPLPPRITVHDLEPLQSLDAGGVAIAADAFASRVDYISTVPPPSLPSLSPKPTAPVLPSSSVYV